MQRRAGKSDSRKFYFCLIFIFLIAYASMTAVPFCYGEANESNSQVWQVGERRWTIQEEYNYSKWIEANVKEDFFIRHKIPVDCADVPYALRWIYARISHLPAAATTANNRFIGHWSEYWRHLPTDPLWHKDRRFRAALLAMLTSTSTRTLPHDAYPVCIDAESVTPGTIFLIPASHAIMVNRLVLDGSTIHPVQTLEANLPTRFQKLLPRNFAALAPDSRNMSGLIKLRWPIETNGRWQYLPLKDQPFYSREQYSPSFSQGCRDYSEAVARRIDPQVYEPCEKITRLMNTINNCLRERIPAVLKGSEACQGNRCPAGSRIWEVNSTATADEYIQVTIDYLKEIMEKNHLNNDGIFGQTAGMDLQVSPNRSVTTRYVLENARWLSPDPTVSIDARWGMDKCGMIAHRLKTAQDSIAFIRRNYSRSDPLFADRSIRMQQVIVDDMTMESQKNNCTRTFVTLTNDL